LLRKPSISYDFQPYTARSRQYRQLPAVGERLQGRIWQAQGRFEDAVEYARSEEAYGLFYIACDKDGDMERSQVLLKNAQATFRRLGVNG
jgi:hypothetical protein